MLYQSPSIFLPTVLLHFQEVLFGFLSRSHISHITDFQAQLWIILENEKSTIPCKQIKSFIIRKNIFCNELTALTHNWWKLDALHSKLCIVCNKQKHSLKKKKKNSQVFLRVDKFYKSIINKEAGWITKWTKKIWCFSKITEQFFQSLQEFTYFSPKVYLNRRTKHFPRFSGLFFLIWGVWTMLSKWNKKYFRWLFSLFINYYERQRRNAML